MKEKFLNFSEIQAQGLKEVLAPLPRHGVVIIENNFIYLDIHNDYIHEAHRILKNVLKNSTVY